MSLLAKGTRLGRPWPRPGAHQAAVGHAEQALDDLEAAAELPAVDLIGEGVEPAVDPQGHVREDLGRDEAAAERSATTPMITQLMRLVAT